MQKEIWSRFELLELLVYFHVSREERDYIKYTCLDFRTLTIYIAYRICFELQRVKQEYHTNISCFYKSVKC